MQIGLIGLGRMGGNMARRMARHGITVAGFSLDPAAAASFADEPRIRILGKLDALVATLPAPRIVWLMVPAGSATEENITALAQRLSPGDLVIDGGNAFYRDSQRRATLLAQRGIGFLDAGVSGGVWGLEEGYGLMVGGERAQFERALPLWRALAPAPDKGWVYCGPPGAGHFTKMVHNGIEYGMMQAYAEGFSIMQHKTDFALDLHQVAEIWREGSVVRSWLLDLTADALGKNPGMDGIAPYVEDSGEGRWTVAEAIDLNVAAPVITASLMERIRSRDDDSFADKLLSAMRNEFGGHKVRAE